MLAVWSEPYSYNQACFRTLFLQSFGASEPYSYNQFWGQNSIPTTLEPYAYKLGCG